MKKKLIYLTINDSFDGIYQSQVIDVIKLYQDQNVEAKLIAIISLKCFFRDKKKIKVLLKESVVLPSFPKLKNWRLNKLWFIFLKISNDSIIIARNIFATNLVLELAKYNYKIIYDGRGAITAEQNEYGVYNGTGVEKEIRNLEKNAVLNSDYRIAVSSKLVEYWEKEFDYKKTNEVIIPCSISNKFCNSRNEENISSIRNNLGIKSNDIILVYSGSISGWQSFDFLKEYIKVLLGQEQSIKMLFLAKEHQIIKELKQEYPNRIFQFFISHDKVIDYLDLADFGLLLRENTITNSVSSPVKCAEYLSRGLKVLISSGIGDYSGQIKKNNLGYIIDNKDIFPTLSLIKLDKENQKFYALDNLSKTSKVIQNHYMKLLDI